MNQLFKSRFYYFTLLFVLFSIKPSFSQMKFQINGKIDNSVFRQAGYTIENGDLITLDFINLERIDSAIVSNEQFQFTGQVDIPSVAMVNFKGGGFLLLIDESEYQVVVAVSEQGNGRYAYDDIRIETQSPFFNLWKNLGMRKGNLNAQRLEVQDLLKGEITDAERNSYEDELQQIEDNLAALYFDASKEHPDTYEMTYLLPGAPDLSYSRYIDYYNKLSDDIKNSFYGVNLYKRLLLTKSN